MDFIVRGVVRDRSNGRGISGLRVEAWDASETCRSLLGYARSDVDGRFSMRISDKELAALVGQRSAKAFFRVIQEPNLLLVDTRESLRWLLDGNPTEVVLQVPPGKPIARVPRLTPFVVRGTVFSAGGPIAGHYVKAYDQRPSSQVALTLKGTQTDARGNYQLTYEPSALAGKQFADLVIKVFSDVACVNLAGESEVHCHAPPTVVIDVTKQNDTWLGLSRHARVSDAAGALLAETNLGIITEEQSARIACSAGVDRTDLDALIGAKRLAASYPSLSSDLAFGLISRGFPASADGFFLHSKSAVSAQLTAALDANLVPQTLRARLGTELENWVQAAKAWALAPRNGRAGLKELLDAAGVSVQNQGSFAEQLLRNEADMPTFWSNLTGGFEAPRIQLALQWGAFTHGHLPLLSWWKAQYDKGQLRTLADACDKAEADWLAILNSSTPAIGAPSDIPGATETERRQSFAKVLARSMATALPMVTFHKRLATSSEPLSIRNFFGVLHPKFDFRDNRLSDPAFEASVSAMSSADKRRIQGMERLFRVVPRYEEVKTLIDAGYFSAHQILEKGRGSFVSQMQSALGGTAEAEAAYNQAAYSAAAAKMIFGKYGQAMHTVQVGGLPDHLTNAAREASQVADWKSLFGSAGGCACEHCKSVLGPAAYFVDLLQWLKRYNVLDELLARRPDLTKIKLTCKSSHTPLPYLDLANEALEVQVASETVSPAPALTTPIETTYEPAELLAGPEIIHPQHHIGAWKAAAAAVHPFTLPRDLWAEEAEVYLRWLGTSREEILRTLSLTTGDSLDTQITRARLGARDDTANAGWRLLVGTHTATTQAVWGGLANYLTELRQVPRFIAIAGLSGLAELEELLATRYVNKPNGTALATLVISPENSCDVDAMTLPALAQGHLDRIHRFIRLARRTGLSFGELDTLLVAFQDEATHIDLSPTRTPGSTR